MAGRTPEQARSAFITPVQQALSCVTSAQVFYRPPVIGETETLRISQEPLRLLRNGAVPLSLSLRQQFRVVHTDDPDRGPWKVATQAYKYTIEMDGREVAAWHWHPLGRSRERRPHLHVPHPPLAGSHVPSGRVSLEGVLRLLLAEREVRPRRSDWETVLDEAEARFTRWRTWA
ncbi:MAG: hypothetical protein ACRD0K_26510 [Egibacteraceae bacterium]